MKQVVAMGRWSKDDKQWKSVVALHRIGSSARTAAQRGEQRPPARQPDER